MLVLSVRLGEKLSPTGSFAHKGRQIERLCTGIEVCVRKRVRRAYCAQFVSLCSCGCACFCGYVVSIWGSACAAGAVGFERWRMDEECLFLGLCAFNLCLLVVVFLHVK